ncbi:MAG: DUF6316 family protein [Gammaproteobacteria bacterium]|nr:DUF6316 family protein [Gammaproteobacteria bacterium]MDH5778807.1 DUF6316 family protein [Gammaproteobacteria bacterium]
MQRVAQQQQANRVGESGQVPLRKKRFYIRENEWFYQTRNGKEHGPYKSLTDAKQSLALFLRRSGVIRFTL